MNTDTIARNSIARRAIETLLAAANGGMPRIAVHVADDGMKALPPFDPDGAAATLFAAFDGAGRLDIAVGIRVHWKMLWHFGFRMARTPGGQLCLLGSFNGRRGHFSIEDDRLWCELGSPLLSTAEDEAAMAAFDAEFSALLARTR